MAHSFLPKVETCLFPPSESLKTSLLVEPHFYRVPSPFLRKLESPSPVPLKLLVRRPCRLPASWPTRRFWRPGAAPTAAARGGRAWRARASARPSGRSCRSPGFDPLGGLGIEGSMGVVYISIRGFGVLGFRGKKSAGSKIRIFFAASSVGVMSQKNRLVGKERGACIAKYPRRESY